MESKYPITESPAKTISDMTRFVANTKLDQAISDFIIFQKNPGTRNLAARLVYEACGEVQHTNAIEDTDPETVGNYTGKPLEHWQPWEPSETKTPEEITSILDAEFADERIDIQKYAQQEADRLKWKQQLLGI